MYSSELLVLVTCRMYVLTCKPLQCIPEPVDEDLRLCSFTELGEISQAQKGTGLDTGAEWRSIISDQADTLKPQKLRQSQIDLVRVLDLPHLRHGQVGSEQTAMQSVKEL